MQRDLSSDKFPIGSKLPEFELPNVDGRNLGSRYLSEGKAALVVFTCNHCPYVKGSEMILIEAARKFEKAGLRVVAISSNDAAQYPEDSFENMKSKAKELELPYPYLYDQSQKVAKMFDAACTPECYLFNASQELVYHGAITDRPKEPGSERKDLLTPALEYALAGKEPVPCFIHPVGCSIKWRVGDVR